MYRLSETSALPSNLANRTVTLNLTLRDGAAITIRSCEVQGPEFRNLMSFQGVSDIDDVLVSPLAHAIRNSLSSVPGDGTHVLFQPEFLVELPGLALSGAHIMVMRAMGGIRNAILRFTNFLGTFNKAFNADLGFQEPKLSDSERLAAIVFADICLPLLNLCREMEFADTTGNKPVPAELLARAREFEFQAELLKRFIFNAGAGRT